MKKTLILIALAVMFYGCKEEEEVLPEVCECTLMYYYVDAFSINDKDYSIQEENEIEERVKLRHLRWTFFYEHPQKERCELVFDLATYEPANREYTVGDVTLTWDRLTDKPRIVKRVWHCGF